MATESVGTPQGATHASGERVFARDSTGLVREVGPVSGAIFNLSYSGAPLALALLFSLGPGLYIGGNLYLGVIFTFILALPTAFVFAMFTSAIPRSGGDYTWISRSLSPVLGFMSNFSYMLWAMFIVGVYGILVPSQGLAPFFRWIAARFNAPGALDVANWFGTKLGTFVVGVVLVTLGGAILIFSRGLRGYVKIQNWTFVYWAIALFLVVPLIMLLASKAGFFSHFDHYVTKLNGKANASQIVLKGQGAGGTAGFSFKESLLLVTIPFYPLGFIYQSAYFAGEMKRGRRGMLLSMPGAQALSVLIFFLAIAAFLSIPGRSFLSGLGSVSSSSYGLASAPLYTELGAIAANNTILGLILLVANILFLAIFVPITVIMVSRSLFAWSFDRLVPEWVSNVNPRTHSPVNAVLVICGIGYGSVALVAFDPSLGALVVLLGQTLTFICVGAAAVAFPYRKRDVFEASPFHGRIGGIPIMSILGGVSSLCMVGVALILLNDLNSGTSWSANRGRVITVAAIFIGGGVIYYLARAIQKRRGINIDLAYAEIPPE
jgi:amino acid transporter